MILKDEQGNEYEFEETANHTKFGWAATMGILKPLDTWPKEGDRYWYVGGDGIVLGADWRGIAYECNIEKFTGLYKTEEEAKLARDRIKSLQEATMFDVRTSGGYNYQPIDTYVQFYVPKKYLKAWEELSK